MTKLEERLRQELQDIAQRLAPADLRSLREPTAQRRPGRARWLAPVAAMASIAVVIAGLVLVRHSLHTVAPEAQTSGHPVPADPPYIAIAGGPRWGSAQAIRMISPETGRVMRTLALVGARDRFTLSPDSSSLFVSGLVRGQNEIRRISVATGESTFVADGAFPAVSPDSRYLAYTVGQGTSRFAVRDLRTGGVRVVDLTSLTGSDSWITLDTVTWLGGGTEVLVVPEPSNVLIEGSPPAVAWPVRPMCGMQDLPGGMCVIVIDVRPHGLSARRVLLHRLSWQINETLSGNVSERRSFLIARMGMITVGAIDEVNLRGRGAVWRQIATLPRRAMPVALAPVGDRILYYPTGHRPPTLWVAGIGRGGLTGQHRVFADNSRFRFDLAAW